MAGMYARIIIDISHEKVDRPFSYRIPERLSGKIQAANQSPDSLWGWEQRTNRLCSGAYVKGWL